MTELQQKRLVISQHLDQLRAEAAERLVAYGSAEVIAMDSALELEYAAATNKDAKTILLLAQIGCWDVITRYAELVEELENRE